MPQLKKKTYFLGLVQEQDLAHPVEGGGLDLGHVHVLAEDIDLGKLHLQ